MLAYSLKRLAWAAITLFLASTLVFFAAAALPGDPARAILGLNATPERLAVLRTQLGLDDPVWQRYLSWLQSLATGDLGTSSVNGQSLVSLMAPRLEATLALVVLTAVIAIPLSIVLGAVTATLHDSVLDRSTNWIALIVVALPEFVVAILLVFLFGGGVLGWFPAVSNISSDEPILGQLDALVLPTMTLVVVVVPYMMRMVRAVMLETLASDYIEMATLAGLSRRTVVLRHALPNALAPTTQVIAVILVYLFGGLVVVESIFGYPGIGSGFVQAVAVRDFQQVQATAVCIAAAAVLVYTVADIIAIAVSPRARTSL